jgi:hypothetical protein
MYMYIQHTVHALHLSQAAHHQTEPDSLYCTQPRVQTTGLSRGFNPKLWQASSNHLPCSSVLGGSLLCRSILWGGCRQQPLQRLWDRV